MPYLGLGIALVIVLAVVIAYNRGAGHPSPAVGAVAPSSAPISGEEQQPIEPGSHIQSGSRGHWTSDPPTSGQHYPVAAAWGYTAQRLPPETWVHNLEHGGVVILYSCPDGCPADVAAVRKFIESAPPEPQFGSVKLVNAPYPVPGHRFAVLSWGWRLFMDSWDPQAALAFYSRHVDHAPEALP